MGGGGGGGLEAEYSVNGHKNSSVCSHGVISERGVGWQRSGVTNSTVSTLTDFCTMGGLAEVRGHKQRCLHTDRFLYNGWLAEVRGHKQHCLHTDRFLYNGWLAEVRGHKQHCLHTDRFLYNGWAGRGQGSQIALSPHSSRFLHSGWAAQDELHVPATAGTDSDAGVSGEMN